MICSVCKSFDSMVDYGWGRKWFAKNEVAVDFADHVISGTSLQALRKHPFVYERYWNLTDHDFEYIMALGQMRAVVKGWKKQKFGRHRSGIDRGGDFYFLWGQHLACAQFVSGLPVNVLIPCTKCLNYNLTNTSLVPSVKNVDSFQTLLTSHGDCYGLRVIRH